MDTADTLSYTQHTMFHDKDSWIDRPEALRRVREFVGDWAEWVEHKSSAQGITVTYSIDHHATPHPDGGGILVATTATVQFENSTDKALFMLSQHAEPC